MKPDPTIWTRIQQYEPGSNNMNPDPTIWTRIRDKLSSKQDNKGREGDKQTMTWGKKALHLYIVQKRIQLKEGEKGEN